MDVAECRSVCRAWDSHAEKARLGHTVIIPNGDKARLPKMHTFLTILTKNHRKGYWIKRLKFSIYTTESLDLMYNLLTLVLSFNINTISGIAALPAFMDRIIKKIQGSKVKLEKMKELTAISIFSTPHELLLLCKETLQTL